MTSEQMKNNWYGDFMQQCYEDYIKQDLRDFKIKSIERISLPCQDWRDVVGRRKYLMEEQVSTIIDGEQNGK